MLALVLALMLQAAPPENLHNRGVQLYKQQKYAGAVAALEQAVKDEKPDTLEYRESSLLIGQSYYMLSQAPKAIPWLEKITSVNEANYMLGYAYLQANQPERSQQAFARLFGLNPATPGAHLVAGQMMLKQEYEVQGVAEINKALAMDPRLPQAHYLLGITAIFRGRFDEAAADLTKEVAVNPNFAMAWYRLGDVQARQEHCDAAIPNLQRAVWLNPDFSGPYLVLGKCYFRQRNFANAEGILKRALLIDPNNSSGQYLLGQTLIAEGKTEEGKAILEKRKERAGPPQ
jgi:tetratricopeptide (TPR) repeat protein